MPRQPIYLDCDTGIDDSMALAYLLARDDVDLVGVGSVFGNVDAARAARNTLDLLALAGRTDVPVAIGAADPEAGRFDGGVPHIHGRNGIGDVELPPSGRDPEAGSAAQLLVRLAREHPGRLRIVTVGPLTNVAAALRSETELIGLVSDVTVMGGAAMAPGNISAVAEANIGNDPEAAAQVLAAAWPITLVPLDVTMANTLEEPDREALLGADRPVARALGAMLDHYCDFYLDIYGRRCSALHDPLAAAIAAGGAVPLLAPTVHVTVDDTAGPGRGQTLCDLRGRYLGYPDQPGAHCRVVLGTAPGFPAHLVQHLLAA
jgi:purine nucleosidase